MIGPRLDEPTERRPFWSRLGWMALIWAASVLVLGAVALVIRWSIGA